MNDDRSPEGRSQNREAERPRVLGGQEGVVTLSHDEAFAVLSDSRRRGVVNYLANQQEVAGLDELATAIAEREVDGEPDEELVDRLSTELHNVHLPRLADEQVVEYDPRSDTVRYWGQPTLEEYANHAAYRERSR